MSLSALERPRTQAELRDALGMSNSGILNLLRRLERDGLVRPAERVAWTRVWEKTRQGG
jgi:DNA-binding Lrp family transcriptional regulator